jgi:MFS family permease
VVNGFGMGMTSTMSPVYLAECVRSHMRGRLLVIGASSNVSSFCLANWMSYGLYYQSGPLQWRFPLAFQLVFACIIGPILLFIPESPRWLLLVDRDEEAIRVVARLAGTTPQDELATTEYRSIKSAIRLERESRVPIMDVLCHRDKTQNFRRLLLSCGTQL